MNMNNTKSCYKTLKFEEKPLNSIKNWTIHPLAAEGVKNYRDKNSFANTFLDKPTLKMVHNVYNKKDKFQGDNYPNVYSNPNQFQQEELEQEDLQGKYPRNEDYPIEENGPNIEKEDIMNNDNLETNKVGFKINDVLSKKEELKRKVKLDTFQPESDTFYRTGFTTLRRCNSNLFAGNSNGVERVLGSNEVNFRNTTNKDKIEKIYNNSLKNYERSLVTPTDPKFALGFVKELESIGKKIETPNHFFGVAPTSNVYVFTKHRRDKSLEGGSGFESYNAPRVESFRKSTSDLAPSSRMTGHYNKIKNTLRVSTGKPSENTQRKKSLNKLNIELPDEEATTTVICKKENSKLKNIIFTYNEQGNFNSKLPTISQIIREPKLKYTKTQRSKELVDKYHPTNMRKSMSLTNNRSTF